MCPRLPARAIPASAALRRSPTQWNSALESGSRPPAGPEIPIRSANCAGARILLPSSRCAQPDLRTQRSPASGKPVQSPPAMASDLSLVPASDPARLSIVTQPGSFLFCSFSWTSHSVPSYTRHASWAPILPLSVDVPVSGPFPILRNHEDFSVTPRGIVPVVALLIVASVFSQFGGGGVPLSLGSL